MKLATSELNTKINKLYAGEYVDPVTGCKWLGGAQLEGDTLQLWSGMGLPEDYALSITIKNRKHLEKLLILMGFANDQ